MQRLAKVPGVGDLAGALTAYTQRHMSRLDRLLRSSFLLDYTLDRLNVLSPLDAVSLQPCMPRHVLDIVHPRRLQLLQCSKSPELFCST